MRVALHTLGCKQNYAESSHIRQQFEETGHRIVDVESECDILIINTCTVTDKADVEARKVIRRALRTSPQAFVGVTGCYAQLQPEEIASIDGVDAVFGAQQKFDIPMLITDWSKRATPQIFVDGLDDLEFVEATFAESDTRTRAFLKIQDGCDYNCSFCTIPLARGSSRSMSMRDIASNVERFHEAGYSEIILTGINLGEYCSQDGKRLIDVLNMLHDMQLHVRFRLSSIEPNTLSDAIIERIASSNAFCKHFHIPLQSGSDEVLRAMRRRYTSARYRDRVMRINELMPHAGIGADVISGFPGETDEHMADTVSFIESLPISYLHVFRYSERARTPAAEYSCGVPREIRRRRTNELRALSVKKRESFYRRALGSTAMVVPEKYHADQGAWSGYSDNYIRVQFESEPFLLAGTVRVELRELGSEVVFGNVRGVATHQRDQRVPGYIPIVV